MKRFQSLFYDLHPLLLSSVASLLTVAQIILAFFLYGQGPTALKWAGWICIWISAFSAFMNCPFGST